MRALLDDRVARVILLVALVLRVGFFVEVWHNDLDLTPCEQLDMIYLHQNALRIAEGDIRLEDPYVGGYADLRDKEYGPERYARLFSKHTYVESPGYLYFAALCERIGPRSPYTVVFVQELLDTLTCAFVYVIARRARGLAAARVALAASALCLECVAEAGFVLRESFIGFLATSFVLALESARARGCERGWFLAGVVFGAGWITKLSFSLVAPWVVLFAWLASGDAREPPGKRARARRTGGALARFGLGAALAIAPFAARNVSLGVRPLQMSTLALLNIAGRHNPQYSGLAEGSHTGYGYLKSILDSTDDTALGVWKATLALYPNPWIDFPAKLLKKFSYYWVAVDFWNNIRCSYLRLLSPWLGLCVCWWGVLGPWAAIGSVLALVRPDLRRPLLPTVIVFLAFGPATAMAGGVFTRYRMVSEPLACVLFATAIVETARAIRRKRALGPILLVVGIALHGLLRDHYPRPDFPLTKEWLLRYALTFPKERAQHHLVEGALTARVPDR
jgi:hypothetical protein